jgi:ParB family chromosome partitioning protein
MIVQDIPVDQVDVSEFNTRKNLADGEYDSTIEDLARSIESQGLLSPISVLHKPSGRYAVIAGQRRLRACKQLGWHTIPAIVRENIMNEVDATAISLVENVHRADMNPRDKAVAFEALLNRYGDLQSVRYTSTGTHRTFVYPRNAGAPDQQPVDMREALGTAELRDAHAQA